MKREKKTELLGYLKKEKYTYLKLEKKARVSDSMKNNVKRSRTLGLANANG